MKPLLSLGLCLLTAASVPPEGEELRVAVRVIEGDYHCSVHAANAPLDHVLSRLAAELGFDLEGLDGARRPTLVSADLTDRPLEQALEFILGSVGLGYQLRSNTIIVQPSPAEGAPRETLLKLAGAAYLRAMLRHPDHALAPGARLDQGAVEELRGFPGTALDHYQRLLSDYPTSPEIPEAYLRSGRILKSLGRWSDAAEQFRQLANLEAAGGDYGAVAKRELAHCTVELQDAQTAYYLITSLDRSHPVGPGPEHTAREIVRALTLVGLERELEALEVIESLQPGLRGPDRVEALRIRARALQGAGHPGDAGRAWLLYANEVREPLRGNALEQAVKLALEAGDEVGAVFICQQAELYGHGLRFTPFREEAYERLGFNTRTASSRQTAEERIEAAESQIQAGAFGEAADQVRGLIVGSPALEPGLRVRLAGVWGRCLNASEGLDGALEYLRETRASLSGENHLEHRSVLDVVAAEMLEAENLLDRAADAYRGIY